MSGGAEQWFLVLFLGFCSGYFPRIFRGFFRVKMCTGSSGLDRPVDGFSRFSTGICRDAISEIQPSDLRLVCPIRLLKFREHFWEKSR